MDNGGTAYITPGPTTVTGNTTDHGAGDHGDPYLALAWTAGRGRALAESLGALGAEIGRVGPAAQKLAGHDLAQKQAQDLHRALHKIQELAAEYLAQAHDILDRLGKASPQE